ncbi:MAG: hypothetical protein AAB375_02765 [Patescibacteria group bacterium]
MMPRMRLAGTVLIVAFFALTLCGAGLLAAHAGNGAHVPGCPFTSTMDASCPQSAIDHLKNFTVILGSLPISALSLSLLLMWLALASVVTMASPLSRRSSFPHCRDDSAIWHPLQVAFARGILNPKSF